MWDGISSFIERFARTVGNFFLQFSLGKPCTGNVATGTGDDDDDDDDDDRLSLGLIEVIIKIYKLDLQNNEDFINKRFLDYFLIFSSSCIYEQKKKQKNSQSLVDTKRSLKSFIFRKRSI